ncbi:MAG TPA: metallophosphoesterase [Thermoanaerobaculia bacterium]
MRVVLFILIAVVVLGMFNALAIWTLLRVHPRRKGAIITAAIIGNLMWLFFPLLMTLTPLGRLTRAVFGPPWFAWTCFAILYSVIIGAFSLGGARFARWPSRVFLSLTIIGSLAGFYEAIVPLRVERVPIYLNNLPAAAEGTRIALLADLHVGLFTRPSRLRQFFETTRALRPDIVILAGDLVDDDPYFTPKLLAATRFLDPRTPLLAVLGNHEMYGDPDRAIAALRGSRIQLLVNDGASIGPLWIAGLSDYAAQTPRLRPNLTEALARRGTNFPVLIAHQPRAFDEARRMSLPLTLVAHTHGGQLGIRPLGWSLAGVFLPYHMGWYRRGAAQLYVNTGTGFWLVPFRLGMTGEITVIELRASSRR